MSFMDYVLLVVLTASLTVYIVCNLGGASCS